jgi:hypothetical protein
MRWRFNTKYAYVRFCRTKTKYTATSYPCYHITFPANLRLLKRNFCPEPAKDKPQKSTGRETAAVCRKPPVKSAAKSGLQ